MERKLFTNKNTNLIFLLGYTRKQALHDFIHFCYNKKALVPWKPELKPFFI